jgi:hypothetical protein
MFGILPSGAHDKKTNRHYDSLFENSLYFTRIFFRFNSILTELAGFERLFCFAYYKREKARIKGTNL